MNENTVINNDSLLDEVLEHFAKTEDRRFFVRCLIERITTEELAAEIEFRANGGKDPFFP